MAAFLKNWIRRAAVSVPTRARRALFAVCTAAITFGCLTPATTWEIVTLFGEYADKCIHFFMYATLAITACLAWLPAKAFRHAPLTIVATACIAYGTALEFLQSAIPALQRTFSISDIAANTLGIGAAAALWWRTFAVQPLETQDPTTA